MADLLAASMIRVDKANLTARFAPRIQQALETLWKWGILGAPARSTTPSLPPYRWGNAWLASHWIMLPSSEIREFYQATLHPFTPPHKSLSPKTEHRKKLRGKEVT
jgi:hypothetical protein